MKRRQSINQDDRQNSSVPQYGSISRQDQPHDHQSAQRFVAIAIFYASVIFLAQGCATTSSPSCPITAIQVAPGLPATIRVKDIRVQDIWFGAAKDVQSALHICEVDGGNCTCYRPEHYAINLNHGLHSISVYFYQYFQGGYGGYSSRTSAPRGTIHVDIEAGHSYVIDCERNETGTKIKYFIEDEQSGRKFYAKFQND